MKTWIKKLFAPAAVEKSPNRRALRRRLQLEQLEDRVTPTLSATLTGTLLTIADTTGQANGLTLSLSGTDLVITDSQDSFAAAPPGGTLSNGDQTLTIPLASVTQLVIDAAAGNDTFTVNYAGGTPVPTSGVVFNGGDPAIGPGDTLVITGNATPFATVTATFQNANDGAVTIGGRTITYTGLEPVELGTADDLILEFQSAAAESIVLREDTATSMFIDSDVGGESLTFNNPTNSLTIRTAVNGGAGADTVTVETLSSGFGGNLTIDGNGDDLIAFGNAATPAGGISLNGGSLTADGQNVLVRTPVATTGTGTIGLTATRNITVGRVFVAAPGSLSTAGGAIALTANAGGAVVGGVPAVAIVDEGSVTTTTGAIAINGTGNGANAPGVRIAGGTGGSLVQTSSGPIAITGSANVANAVEFADDAQVLSTSGNIAVNGTGTVQMNDQAEIATAGAVRFVVAGNLNEGVPLVDATSISANELGVSATGNVSLTLDNVVNVLAVSAGGTVAFRNTAALAVGAVSASGSFPATSGVTGVGAVGINVADAAAAGQTLTINTGRTVRSTGSSVSLQAGDGYVDTGATVRAATTISVAVDAATPNPDVGTGATVTFQGTYISSTGTSFLGGADADTLNLQLASMTQSLTVNGQGGADAINVNAALAITGGGADLSLTAETINLNASPISTPDDQTYNGPVTLTVPVTVAGNEIDFLSTVALGANNLTVNTNSPGSQVIGAIDGTGGLVKQGTGTLTLLSVNTYSGNTTVSGGTLALSVASTNSIASSPTVTLAAAGTLNVTGLTAATIELPSGQTLTGNGAVVGSVRALSGSTVSPGISATGTITVGTDLTLEGGSSLAIEIAAVNPVANSDRVAVSTGDVVLNGATLSLSGSGAGILFGDVITLIDNQGAGTTTGTFAGLPEGSTIPNFLGTNKSAVISYAGGDGNDVILGFGVFVANNTLYVVGTSADDLASVYTDGVNYWVRFSLGGEPIRFASFPLSAANRIEMDGDAGNDHFSIMSTMTQPSIIEGGEGADTLTGGAGDDLIYGGTELVPVDAGNDVINAGNGTNTVDAGHGNNRVTAGTGSDTITTGLGNDTIDAGNGDDLVLAGDGNNNVILREGNNTFVSGTGADTVTAGAGADTITTGGGDDVILAGNGANVVDTGEGNDRVTAGTGNDSINVGEGNNRVEAGDGANTIMAGSGNDSLYAGNGIDLITAGEGDNLVSAGDGANTVTAGAGNDRITSGNGNSTITAGDGNNFITVAGGANTITSGSGRDTIEGGSGDDLIRAGAGDDSILGGAGNDIILGEDGNDFIEGGLGLDLLIGGLGSDRVQGGQGADIVVGGQTTADASNAALQSILAAFVLNPTTAPALTKIDDGEVDTLFGGAGIDFIFGELLDITDVTPPETLL